MGQLGLDVDIHILGGDGGRREIPRGILRSWWGREREVPSITQHRQDFIRIEVSLQGELPCRDGEGWIWKRNAKAVHVRRYVGNTKKRLDNIKVFVNVVRTRPQGQRVAGALAGKRG